MTEQTEESGNKKKEDKDLKSISPNLEKRKAREKALSDEIEKQAKRFQDGQILRFVRVRFPGNAKSFAFLVGNRELDYGQKVVAMSDRGMAVGYINSFPYEVGFNHNLLPVRSINKIATDEDIDKQKDLYRKEKEIETICLDLISKHKLDMNLTHVEFTQFGKKTVFYFTAPQRIDFRNLVKDLVGKLKTRIELRQISLRDRAAAVGGIGPCGRQVCCSSFLSKYGKANIKMAKNQNLNLNFSKLNGVCGQLKCCLNYEDDYYCNKRKKLPSEGSLLSTANGDLGRVDRVHIIQNQFDMLTDRGIRKRYAALQFDRTRRLPKDWKFPRQFDHVTNELSPVIGVSEQDVANKEQFDQEISEIKIANKDFAKTLYSSFFEHFQEDEITGKVFINANYSKVDTEKSENKEPDENTGHE